MRLPNRNELENLFQKHRVASQQKWNCALVLKHLKALRYKIRVIEFTKEGIILECSDRIKRRITWKGKPQELIGNAFKSPKKVGKGRDLVRKSGNRGQFPKRARERASKENVVRSPLFQKTVRFSSARFRQSPRSQRLPDDYEAGDVALRMWE